MHARALGAAMATAVAAAIAFGAAGTARAEAWTPDPDDAVLLEVRLKQYILGEGVRGYALGGGKACVILPDIIEALDLPIAFDAAAGTARGWAFSETRTVALDRKRGTLVLSGKAVPPAGIRDAPEGPCVETSALATWFAVGLELDSGGAALTVRSESKLPVELAIERRARVAATPRPVQTAGLPRVRLPYLLFRPPALDAVVTANFVRDRNNGTRFDRRYELFGAGELAGMSVDGRLGSDNRGRPSTVRARAFRTDPDARLLGPLRATHVGLGDVAGLASPLVSNGGAGRGVLVTNRPTDRPEQFDRVRFEGDLPAGWDAELYRNDQLVAFAGEGASGRYAFRDVPLQVGDNRFAVVLYGPQGQVRREEQRVRVGADSIPRGRTYYWAGVNQDGRDLVTLARPPPGTRRQGWQGALGLEHGLDARTSLALSVQTLVIGDERLTYAEGAVRRAVGPALVELSGAYSRSGGHALRAQALGQIGSTYLSAESVVSRGGFLSDRVERDVTGRHQFAADRTFRAGQVSIPARIEARTLTRRDAPDRLEAAARLGVSYNNFSLTGGIDWRRQRGGGGPNPPEELLFSTLGNLRLRGVQLRGEARWRVGGGLESVALAGELGATETSQWRGELGWDGPAERGRASVGWSKRFRQFSLGVVAEGATDGSIAGGLNLAFSLGAGTGLLRPSVDSMASSGQVLARVFRDLNADGVRQADEPAAPAVGITAGTAAVNAPTDARGRAVVGRLQPYRPVSIGVDTSTLSDPSVGPGVPGQIVVPRPGIVAVVDIPLVGTGEVEGTLVRDGGGGLEAVPLELVDARGQRVAGARTEFDGYFLFEKVPYGAYRLRVEALSAGLETLEPALDATATVSEAKPTAALGAVVAKSSRTTS